MTDQINWKSWINEYFREPATAWGNPGERQVTKLESVLTTARTRHNLDREQFIQTLIDAVEARPVDSTKPIYLVNLGGCGSHWVSRMMAQAGNLADAGEVYLPPNLYRDLLKGNPNEGARILDAVELAHGLLYGLSPDDFLGARMINSAHGCEKIAFYRALRPDARVIHLVRDPRDRTMSVSFRKAEFRAYESTGLDDFGYMLSKARRSQSYWDRYSNLAKKADLQISYESFRSRGPDTLASTLAAVDIEPPRELVDRVSWLNSPEYLRSAEGKRLEKGNLDQGGIAKSWRELEPKFQRTMHSVMAVAIEEQGYPICDCFPGETLPGLPEALSWRQLAADLTAEQLGSFQVQAKGDSAWITGAKAWELDSTVARVRYRIGRSLAPPPGTSLMKAAITDICAAGRNRLDDDTLSNWGNLASLQALDLAGTNVQRPLPQTQFPQLARVNLSACMPGVSHAGEIRDY
ncbi:sulfotransferase [Arenimonas aestuarii]